MRIRDRIALAWRGYWAEFCHEARRAWLQAREENREATAAIREARHWNLVVRRKITGKQDPTRKDVRRAVREHRREQRREGR